MRRIALVLAALLPSAAALADCQSDIALSMRRARALPATAGRAALLEQIQRAEVARHEGDDGDCADQIRDAIGVLDSIDDAKKRAASIQEEPKRDQPKPSQGDSGGQGKTSHSRD